MLCNIFVMDMIKSFSNTSEKFMGKIYFSTGNNK